VPSIAKNLRASQQALTPLPILLAFSYHRHELHGQVIVDTIEASPQAAGASDYRSSELPALSNYHRELRASLYHHLKSLS
jgi:hypothetical protein